jgi:hypothetical protein
MSFHWSGLASVPGRVILVAAVAVMPILFVLVVLAFIYILGSIISDGVEAKRRRLKAGQSPEQFLKAAEQLAAEQVRKAEEDWSLPPELNLPTPRPVKSAPLGTRLSRSLPRILFLLVLAIVVYTFGFLYTHVTHARWPQDLPSFIFRGFLDFLHAPQWQRWMLWPSIIFAGLAGLSALPGYFKRREEQRLLRWGMPARAVVTSATMGVKQGSRWNFEYHDAAGNLVKSFLIRSSMPQPGQDVLTVLYDPDKPQQFITYPVARYEIGARSRSRVY